MADLPADALAALAGLLANSGETTIADAATLAEPAGTERVSASATQPAGDPAEGGQNTEAAHRIRELITEEADLPAGTQLNPAQNLRADLGLDELGLWRIVATAEHELHKEVFDDEVAAVETVADLGALFC